MSVGIGGNFITNRYCKTSLMFIFTFSQKISVIGFSVIYIVSKPRLVLVSAPRMQRITTTFTKLSLENLSAQLLIQCALHSHFPASRFHFFFIKTAFIFCCEIAFLGCSSFSSFRFSDLAYFSHNNLNYSFISKTTNAKLTHLTRYI